MGNYDISSILMTLSFIRGLLALLVGRDCWMLAFAYSIGPALGNQKAFWFVNKGRCYSHLICRREGFIVDIYQLLDSAAGRYGLEQYELECNILENLNATLLLCCSRRFF